MGSKVTQPPGILLHPVTPPGSYLSIPKPAPAVLVTVSAWEHLRPPQSQVQVCSRFPRWEQCLPCAAALRVFEAVSLGWGLRTCISNAFPGAAEGGLHLEKHSSRWIPFSTSVIIVHPLWLLENSTVIVTSLLGHKSILAHRAEIQRKAIQGWCSSSAFRDPGFPLPIKLPSHRTPMFSVPRSPRRLLGHHPSRPR